MYAWFITAILLIDITITVILLVHNLKYILKTMNYRIISLARTCVAMYMKFEENVSVQLCRLYSYLCQ